MIANSKIGKITSEHSDDSDNFNLDDYLKFREENPDDNDNDIENENEENVSESDKEDVSVDSLEVVTSGKPPQTSDKKKK